MNVRQSDGAYYISDLAEGNWPLPGSPMSFEAGRKAVVNVIALGDVGGMLLTGLRLLGGDVIERIGIFDPVKDAMLRYETEINQIAYPFGLPVLPEVSAIREEQLFDCDVFVFCATKAVPEVGTDVSDVRMAQFAENRKIVEFYGRLAGAKGYEGIFAVVSDPVDPLCKAAWLSSGLSSGQFKGFGLGVMNSRAMYYAQRNSRYARYLIEGRVFGPHGADLICADSIDGYDHGISLELTELVVNSNLKMRKLGFKPYIAPALSSGAISILLMLRGQWHYSSNYIGKGEKGAFLGAKNRMGKNGTEIEDIALPVKLFERIKNAHENLKKII